MAVLKLYKCEYDYNRIINYTIGQKSRNLYPSRYSKRYRKVFGAGVVNKSKQSYSGKSISAVKIRINCTYKIVVFNVYEKLQVINKLYPIGNRIEIKNSYNIDFDVKRNIIKHRYSIYYRIGDGNE